jgi:hypothetical protein
VSAFVIVKALDVVQHIGSRLVSGPVRFATCAVLSDEKKLFIAALSRTLPERLIEQMTP